MRKILKVIIVLGGISNCLSSFWFFALYGVYFKVAILAGKFPRALSHIEGTMASYDELEFVILSFYYSYILIIISPLIFLTIFIFKKITSSSQKLLNFTHIFYISSVIMLLIVHFFDPFSILEWIKD